MTNDDEIMTAEEFFGEIDNTKRISSRTCCPRGQKSEKDIFTKAKVKMVMRIYGVSRERAREIIAVREAENGGSKMAGSVTGKDGRADETLMTAEDFFA